MDGDILSFCYPRCHYSEGAREAVRDAGFTNAVTCGARGSWDLYTLKREVFHTLDGPAVTAMKTRGAYSALGDTIAAKGIRVLARAYDRLIPRRS